MLLASGARDASVCVWNLEQRRCALGGMLELARTLDAWRLVKALEAHANELRRQIEALQASRGARSPRAPFFCALHP